MHVDTLNTLFNGRDSIDNINCVFVDDSNDEVQYRTILMVSEPDVEYFVFQQTSSVDTEILHTEDSEEAFGTFIDKVEKEHNSNPEFDGAEQLVELVTDMRIKRIEYLGEGEIVDYIAENGQIKATAWVTEGWYGSDICVAFIQTEDNMLPDIDTEARIELPYEGWELEDYYDRYTRAE